MFDTYTLERYVLFSMIISLIKQIRGHDMTTFQTMIYAIAGLFIVNGIVYTIFYHAFKNVDILSIISIIIGLSLLLSF